MLFYIFLQNACFLHITSNPVDFQGPGNLPMKVIAYVPNYKIVVVFSCWNLITTLTMQIMNKWRRVCTFCERVQLSTHMKLHPLPLYNSHVDAKALLFRLKYCSRKQYTGSSVAVTPFSPAEQSSTFHPFCSLQEKYNHTKTRENHSKSAFHFLKLYFTHILYAPTFQKNNHISHWYLPVYPLPPPPPHHKTKKSTNFMCNQQRRESTQRNFLLTSHFFLTVIGSHHTYFFKNESEENGKCNLARHFSTMRYEQIS